MSDPFSRTRRNVDADALIGALVNGSRRALARAITFAESTRADHRALVDELLQRLAERARAADNSASPRTLRVGISGAPGVGKSTFIEAFGLAAIAAGRRLAVLAVDPSSSLSGGSILGDKTRMPELSRHEQAFVRPSPAGTTLGGVTRRTRESIVFCEAAGFDLILVETVGVGQSEVAVAAMTDLFVLLLSPGGGDELQGIKRGIMELTDVALITKADGDLVAAAGRAASDCANALRLMRPRSQHWQAVVRSCSALTGEGILQVLAVMDEYESTMRAGSALEARRQAQASDWLRSEITEQLLSRFAADEKVQQQWQALDEQVRRGDLPASGAAQQVVRAFLGEGTTGEGPVNEQQVNDQQVHEQQVDKQQKDED